MANVTANIIIEKNISILGLNGYIEHYKPDEIIIIARKQIAGKVLEEQLITDINTKIASTHGQLKGIITSKEELEKKLFVFANEWFLQKDLLEWVYENKNYLFDSNTFSVSM